MEEVLPAFAHLTREHHILADRRDNQLAEYKAWLVFRDGSLLEFSETQVFMSMDEPSV